MGFTESRKTKIAIVHTSLPTVEEIDQFKLLGKQFELVVISSESICGFLTENSWFKDLTCIALPDHDENTTYLPGLEMVLAGFDIVILKGRLGMYAYQAIKAKWRNKFRLMCWIDNLTVFPSEDLDSLRTIRNEVSNMVDAFIVQTNAAAATLKLEGIEADRIIKFSPYAQSLVGKKDQASKAKAMSMLGLKENDIAIGHVGTLEWEEGLLDLIHGAKIAMEKDQGLTKRLKLVFCAIGSYASQLKERLITLGIDKNAVFVSPSREALAAFYNGIDGIFYSTTESLDRLDGDPYRLISAMANRVPVIGCRTPVMEEYMGKHRLDYCKGSPRSVANAINKLVSAHALVKNIVTKNSEYIHAHLTSDLVAIQMDRMLNKVIKKAPVVDLASVDHQVIEAESKVANKQYLEAIDVIDSIFALENVPVYHKSNLYRLIGDSFTKLGDSDMGKNAYLQAIELDPFSYKAYIGLGTAAMTRSSYQTAIIHFQKAVALAPKDEMANLGLGLAFQGLGEMKEAGKWVVNALELNPENTAAIYSLVKISQERDSYNDAEKALRRYIERHPYDHNMIYSLAGVLFAVNRYQEVIEVLQEIIKVDPKDMRAQTLIKQAKRHIEDQLPKGNVG